MPLTNEQLNQAQAHVRQHFKKCPCCETNSEPLVEDKLGQSLHGKKKAINLIQLLGRRSLDQFVPIVVML